MTARSPSPPQSAAAELSRIFDESFVRETISSYARYERFLLIRAGEEPFAVRTLDVAELVAGTRVVRVPSHMPETLGILAIRGVLVPVFELARLLGRSASGRRQSWVMVINRESPIALAFDKFDGQVEVSQSAVYDDDRPEPQTYVRQIVKIGASVRAIVDVGGMVRAISERGETEEPDGQAVEPAKESLR
jgi:chemotaxis signal transduction protein